MSDFKWLLEISGNSDVHLVAAISIYMADGAHVGANVDILEEWEA